MTRVTIEYDPHGNITAYSARGHSGFAESGRDIVCAAASVLLQTAVYGLTEVAGTDPEVTVDERTAALAVVLEQGVTNEQEQKRQAILQTMRLGLLELQRQFPKNISIAERRCN